MTAKRISLQRGDITSARVDAIVNAANSALLVGGGVDDAIHSAGGPSILRECRQAGSCPTGGAVATTAGALHARHVIHAVAPIWQGGRAGEAELLASAYRRSLEVAEELGDKTIAFPSLGTGAYGYPISEAAETALGTVGRYLDDHPAIEHVTFYLFSDADLTTYRGVLKCLRS